MSPLFLWILSAAGAGLVAVITYQRFREIEQGAFALGVRDGFESPSELSSGITYGDFRDEAYDRGVNLGQFLRRIVRHEAGG